MYGLEQYQQEARKAGLVDRLKAEKFDEIRDAARELTKTRADLMAAEAAGDQDRVFWAREAVKTDEHVLNRFIQRAAEGDL